MHDSSMREMLKFSGTLPRSPLKIADIGSRGESNYAPFFTIPGWGYVGMDMQEGKNVHRVLPSAYEWANVGAGEFDVVISGQCMEHVPMPWRWMKEVARILKPGGIACIIGPHSWEYHPSPLDCWRIWPDGMKACMEEAGFSVVNCFKNENDTVGIGKKA
jgi:SAM-dependent methyltransferase